MSKIKFKKEKPIDIPEPSKFDRLDQESLYLLVEQALGTAQAQFDHVRGADPASAPAFLDYCNTALMDAQAGIKAILRKKLVILQTD